MKKKVLLISAVTLIAANLFGQLCFAKENGVIPAFKIARSCACLVSIKDTVPPPEVMEVVTAAINSLNSFNIEAVANLYTPNAVVADDEPPFSWNGPTAGIQWVNAVEQVCKDNHLTKLKGSIINVSVFQQNLDNVYIVVPVTYTGILPGKATFESDGAFTFVLRMVNGRWMIKSQVWMSKKGM
jgi:ketosteroid isomerase-like protein